ncbi:MULTISPECIES: phosphate ABC transporter substrate-binding protein [unclassified Microcoleus]|uniref:phosphate ABC transporter substrate-binding protein n=1 Tax=unclassified Microcoleus TaxID=2642155 RepID=UPI001D63082D|nr:MULTISPECIES: phosphate ABC transporter substrate-binding protein [unclassified Microcoleus]MCC3473911.1 phosphate ABC transporter substrate-binding protein [Microcoleus sp. PH2017_13_LAR_U_A]MCC3486349.1 phosphate ABC transporter substrate-binding protein [Microcoleus sp. PH2017_14_LAR_D_A]
MAKSGPPPIVFIFLFLFLAAGGWFFLNKPAAQDANNSSNPPTPAGGGSSNPLPVAPAAGLASPVAASSFALPVAVPAGTAVRIDGSTSMVTINLNLKNGFQAKFPSTTVDAKANGSAKGIQDLVAGTADIAAISTPLKAEDQAKGLAVVPVALDRIAIVVGTNNPFQGGLTAAQVQDIFKGNAQDWSKVGGSAGPIKVINRPEISGTHQTFKEQVLGGGSFGTGPNFATLDRDATTPLLQALGNNGIGYATFAQVVNQKTVRVVPVDATTPEAPNYRYQRQLYYAYKNPPSQAVKDFLGYATSEEGKKAMLAGN